MRDKIVCVRKNVVLVRIMIVTQKVYHDLKVLRVEY